ncbi:LysE family translocator [Reichenbachiella agariperforans]|uniref:LysE family translocator n=1 Tax=Reichenbachiella agariperforans TaxID=156994 RepID=UPI001C085680|nr:LysE family transporter [Reichenbachiella agariperforans]MBU2913148.1 LysE family transporter [Reichenbachiella agariperforans]
MPPYLIGLSTGLILAVSTGPVFLTLIQKSIDHGYKKALFFVLGVGIADTGIIAVTWFGMTKVTGDTANPWMVLAGGLLLISFGLVFLIKKENPEELEIETRIKKKNFAHVGLLGQGFMLGAINPIVWAFWAAMSNYAIVTFTSPRGELFYFFGILSTVWLTDSLKAYYAEKLKKYLSPKVKRYLRMTIGIVLIAFGLKLLIQEGIAYL